MIFGIKKLWDKLDREELKVSVKFSLSAISNKGDKDREKREVIQDIKFCEIIVGPPKEVKKFKDLKPETKLTAILCSERDKERDYPIEWLLLTTIQVKSLEDALKIVEYYICRWQIEIYFKILKSGCSIEEIQLEAVERIENCLSLYMIIAWRILFLSMVGRCVPNLPCELFYEREEWEAAWQVTYRKRPPYNSPTINEINLLIAKFGGFLNRKSDGNPGIKVMWIGLQILRNYTDSYIAFKQSNICG